ncbi:ATP-binding cassette domain-containing protein [Acinetobacter sp. GFQ9D192M]|uniref:ATP-binding cassette domain-containing protein n=1 Tax=unclassified Acinetobacter TaxID=196816 RepID=UPI001407F263|nr:MULTISPECIES: ATP-binding cassette domain-containing protein [unclassified Acinetobacter]NHB66226.1 ATP-binding cassette domain-containing protein [Acinetobacter sp. GFQ9D191M]NHC00331.1 ATP-binding cassette domain-containing protein [Acinetobacter sp. GFQ9D192M]
MLKCDFQYQQADFELNIKLEISQQLLGIVGASGSGKSTLLKNIVGLLKPDQGYIQFNQQDLTNIEKQINIPIHQRKIALVFQNALLFPHMNVQQNLCYAEKLISKADRKFQFEDIVELLELKPLIYRKAHQLSGGEAQRVSIGRALLSSPNLLLLDEPLTGLDQQLKQQILPFLKRIKDELNLPMIYVTHHLEELAYLEAETVQLKKGILIRN